MNSDYLICNKEDYLKAKLAVVEEEQKQLKGEVMDTFIKAGFAVIFIILTVVGLTLLNGLLVMLIWNWLIAPTVGIKFTYGFAIGLSIISSLLIRTPVNINRKNQITENINV